MLETVNLDAAIPKRECKAILEQIDLQLAQLQRDLRPSGSPLLIVFEGWDAAGKGMVLNRMLEPLDPRGFKVYNIKAPTEVERMYPPLWRFWQTAPPRGGISIYNHSWYREVLQERVEAGLDAQGLQAAYEHIRTFERQLDDDGAVVVKFFLHISKKEQSKRFSRLEKNEAFAWKIGKAEKRRHKRYREYYDAAEDMLRETSTSYAPWTVVPSTDDNFAKVLVAETLRSAFQKAVERKNAPVPTAAPVTPRRTSPLDRVDLGQTITPEEYDDVLPKLQSELRRLQHVCYFKRRAALLVFEGWDAAGKGGTIRRLARQLDPRGYEVNPVAAPQGDERTHHYLWRFWRALPKAGHLAIFDRSWYGRVLVERVEGFATPQEWQRAYREINEFETQIVEAGAVLIKFWFHISKDEQLNRFQLREQEPHKRWKITDEDWRNREKWEDYWGPVSDMLEKTSTAHAPWVVVEGNDKRFARVKVLETVAQRLSQALEGKPLKMPRAARKQKTRQRPQGQPAPVQQAS
ncbi:MAG: polyphosphate:AMP phosphotransferase [Candidatus Hydrogenedentes bacterium]|nr:polyphosphate:AMP phosphotransferase [Candidatus Hydrogenedentota bacterium]